jgi:hypothetical protein
MVFFPRLTHNMQIMRDKTAVSKNGTIQQKAVETILGGQCSKKNDRPPSVPFPGLRKCAASVRDPGGQRFGGRGSMAFGKLSLGHPTVPLFRDTCCASSWRGDPRFFWRGLTTKSDQCPSSTSTRMTGAGKGKILFEIVNRVDGRFVTDQIPHCGCPHFQHFWRCAWWLTSCH